MHKNIFRLFGALICSLVMASDAFCQAPGGPQGLKVVFIRHAEKPLKGDNLNCQGLNRSLELPAMLVQKFGLPAYVYVPKMGHDTITRHSRMFQTIVPLAIKYNLSINSTFNEKDSSELARDIKTRSGTVLVVWEHRAIAPIVRSLGLKEFQSAWTDEDYGSIWIVDFQNDKPSITYDKEGLTPADACSF